MNIGDGKGNMVQSFSFFIDIPGNHSIGLQTFKQFNFIFSGKEKSGVYFLGFNGLGFITGGIQ